jgi:hypothetical protein
MTRLKVINQPANPQITQKSHPTMTNSMCPSTSINMTMFKTCVLLVKNWISPSWMMINPNKVRIAQLLKKKMDEPVVETLSSLA